MSLTASEHRDANSLTMRKSSCRGIGAATTALGGMLDDELEEYKCWARRFPG